MNPKLLTTLCVLVCFSHAFSQDTSSLSRLAAEKSDKLIRQYVTAVGDKSAAISTAIDQKTLLYLGKLEKEENVIYRKINKLDSLQAQNLFAGSIAKYQQLQADVKIKASSLQKNIGQYLSWSDTASTALKFLNVSSLAGKLPVSPAKLQDAINKVKDLEGQLKTAETIKDFIHQREACLQQLATKYNLGNDINKYKSIGYYYIQEVNDYKEALKDEGKAEKKALSLLQQYGPFQQFMAKNGVLGNVFNIPADYASSGTGNLQTINQVQEFLQAHLKNMGPSGTQTAMAGISAVQGELSKLRSRFSNLGSTADMPDFNPHPLKTKPFLKRLLLGFDMQTTKANHFIPTYSDFAFTVGYKASDRLTAGIGLSYKMGWGADLRHIHLSSQGIAIRTYMDWKIIRSFFITAGGEANYLSAFSNIKELKDYAAWKPAALVGISKTVSLKSKYLKSTKVSLLYDFLHAYQLPQTQAIVLRAGYNF